MEACDEMDYYEQKPDGSMGAVDGQHDDRVITTAGVVWLTLQMPPVAEVDINQPVGITKRGGWATFN